MFIFLAYAFDYEMLTIFERKEISVMICASMYSDILSLCTYGHKNMLFFLFFFNIKTIKLYFNII